MNTKSIQQAKNVDFHHIQVAMERAAQRAREIAKQTNTCLVVQQNGQLVKLKVK